MADHTMFIAWAFERHCKKHLNADFEVCDDPACQVAVEFEQAAKQYAQADECPEGGIHDWSPPKTNYSQYCSKCGIRR